MTATSERTTTRYRVQFKRNRDERVRAGHPWVFSGEVLEKPPAEAHGQIVDVYDSRGKFMGQGYCNVNSNILVRLLNRRVDEVIDRAWWKARLQEAIALRAEYVSGTDACRLVNGEADGLPALIVDKYGDYLSIQVLSHGIEVRLPEIVEILAELVQPKGIYERSDVPVRRLEGLEQRTGVLWGEAPPSDLSIQEGPYRLNVDIVTGQKTGFFLDQRPNRLKLGELSKGKRVLNCFSYSGGFSMAAAVGGASEVVSVDISAEAIALGEANAKLNGVEDRCKWVVANAFDYLRELEKAGEKFDVVILDPPAFTKTKDSIPGAVRGYKEINLRGMRLLKPGGLLVSASCSHHINPSHFVEIIQSAAVDSYKRLRMLALEGAGMDHPILPAASETNYLKCFYGTVH
ncbi:Ribosomal RNA large subunit methyltransferase I [compost metagenome]